MSRSKAILMLLVAMLFGLFAMVAAAKQMTQAGGAQKHTTSVAAAARDIPFGSVLKEEDIKLIEWPGEPPFKKGSYFKDAKELAGRVLKSDLVEGEPILEGELAPPDSKVSLAAFIPPGMRAYAVKIDRELEQGSLLVKGARVDVVVTLEPEGRSMEKVSKTILHDVEVLCVGMPPLGEEAEADAKPAQSSFSKTSTVILLVTPLDAEKLHLATTEGRISLVVRGFSDKGEPDMAKSHRVTTVEDALGILPRTEKTETTETQASPAEPTPQELFNVARALQLEGKVDEAIKQFKVVRQKFPGSEYAVKALEEIGKIEARRRKERRRAAFIKQLERLQQIAAAGDFDAAAKLAEELNAEYADLTLDNGQQPRAMVDEVRRNAQAAEKQARRVYQMFRNFLLLKMYAKAEQQLAILQQRYPKSRYARNGAQALEAAKKGQSPPPAPRGGLRPSTSKSSPKPNRKPKPATESKANQPLLVAPAQ